MSKRVVIVGGGLAGLAAAEALSARGLSVTLLEARPRLGGRASSFEDKATGTQIDNCQHVSMGCCTNFRKFCERGGLLPAFETQGELTFIGRDGVRNTFRATSLPAPLHLAPAFFRLSYLDTADRACLAAGLKALAKADSATIESEPFDAWLKRHQQTPQAIERFWHVVVVSALSETLDRVSAAHARKVFVDAFLAHRNGWTVQIPITPLDELYGGALTRHLESQNVRIRLGAGVKTLEASEVAANTIELRNGERVGGDEFVVAVPQNLLRPMLARVPKLLPMIEQAERLETAAISSVHLWFDRPITQLPHAVLVERLSQWLFNRTMLQDGGQPRDGRYYYQIVISASHELSEGNSAQTIESVCQELREIWRAACEATLLHSRLVTEHRAVISVRPGSDALRPPQQSLVPNVQIAGDWTQTGWPGTMEGAVRSGYLAAENVLARLGRPEKLIQDDLPTSWLSRLAMGLR